MSPLWTSVLPYTMEKMCRVRVWRNEETTWLFVADPYIKPRQKNSIIRQPLLLRRTWRYFVSGFDISRRLCFCRFLESFNENYRCVLREELLNRSSQCSLDHLKPFKKECFLRNLDFQAEILYFDAEFLLVDRRNFSMN